MNKSTKKKSIKGVKWTSINTLYNAIITPFFYALLAILLSPEGYAYLAVLTLVNRLAPIIAGFGIEKSYIQSEKITNNQNAALFTFTIISSFVMSIILLILSPFIESIYNLNNLRLYLYLMTIVIIGSGIQTVSKAALKKKFLFKEIAIIQILKTNIRVFVTLGLVISGVGVVSFVIGLILSALYSLIAFITIAYKNLGLQIYVSLHFSSVKDILKHGLPITIKEFIEHSGQRIDEVIIGTLISAEILGVYFFGKNFIMQVRNAIIKSFSTVLLPLYTEIRNSKKAMQNTYYTIINLTSLIGFPILIGISLTADLFIPVFLGVKWVDSVLVVQVLSIAIIFPVIIANNATSFLYSLKKSFLILNVEILLNILYFLSLILFVNSDKFEIVLFLFSLYLISNAICLQYFVNKQIKSNMFYFISSIKI